MILGLPEQLEEEKVEDMNELLKYWNVLNTDGKKTLLNYANDLIEIERFTSNNQQATKKASTQGQILKFKKSIKETR